MKPNSAASVREVLTQLKKITADIPQLQSRAADNEKALASLESAGDLEDKATLDEIIRRQAFAALFPRRIAARENDLQTAEQALQKATDGFISGELSPRLSEVSRKIRKEVRIALKPHFSDDFTLDRAVENSELVQQLDRIGSEIVISSIHTYGGVVDYANRKLKALEAVETMASRAS